MDLPSRQDFAQPIAMVKRRRYKRKPFKPIDYEQFRELRLMNRFTIEEVAKMLQVTARTIRHWEEGKTRIPYSAYKLLRIRANGEFLDGAWNGWVIRGDTLWSPVGRPFRQHELTYISGYFQMARFWREDYARRQLLKQSPAPLPAAPYLRVIEGGQS